MFIVLIGEGYVTVFQFLQPMIGNRHSVGVTTEVIEDAVRATEWRFGIDHPVVVVQRRQIARKAVGIGQGLQFTVEMQFSCCVGLLQITQIEFSKATRKNLYWQEEAGTAGHPTAAVPGDATTRHDTVQMGMKIEGLSPRMQDAEEADLRSQVLRIGRHRL